MNPIELDPENTGHDGWLRICGPCLRHGHGEPVRTSRSIQDLTEYRRVSERLRLAVEASPSGMMMVDRRSIIVMVNREIETTFGYRREELVGQSVEVLVPRRFRERHPAMVEEFFRHPRATAIGEGRELYGQRKDGREIPVEIGLTPVETEDGLFVLAAIADITKRRVAEDARKRYAAALQRSNEDLQQFAYVASHDLQEPLRKVARFCGLLESSCADKLDDEAKSYIRFAVDGANRLRRMVNDLLVYSRVQLQGEPLRQIDANEALQEAIDNLQWTIEEAEAVVTCEQLPKVCADELQLTQLFQNLIGNAIKYRGDKAPQIHVGIEESDREWTFSVRDNGIGIAPEFHQRIFGIFKRLHGPDEFSGTGIGLAICRRIVERLGGTIRIESEVGQGSTFFFTLPRSRGAGRASVTGKEPARDDGRPGSP